MREIRNMHVAVYRTTSPNRNISNFANAPSKFFATLGTTDVLQPLGEIIIKVNKL
jgi:hypothetical protein